MKLFCRALILAGAAALMCGCKSTRLAYFDDLPAAEVAVTLPVEQRQIQIEPNDELLIQVTSEVPEAVAIYSRPLTQPIGATEVVTSTAMVQQQTYRVKQDGDIDFPVLGRIHVQGQTTGQVAEYLTRRIAEDVEAPIVTVSIVNFKVKVLGEVAKPGSFLMNTERVTVLDALAEAGDLTMYGRRDNIVVIREEDGQAAYHKLNLNDSQLVTSPYYYLKQNDVVYVQPTEARKGAADYNQNNSYKVSVVSAIISACSVVASLIIALVL